MSHSLAERIVQGIMCDLDVIYPEWTGIDDDQRQCLQAKWVSLAGSEIATDPKLERQTGVIHVYDSSIHDDLRRVQEKQTVSQQWDNGERTLVIAAGVAGEAVLGSKQTRAVEEVSSRSADYLNYHRARIFSDLSIQDQFE